MLVVKMILVFVGVGIGDLSVIKVLRGSNMLNTNTISCLVLLTLILLFVVLYNMIIKPLSKLHGALKVIDFEKDVIDFSKLDQLSASGVSELKLIIKKFQYLLDIITERIDRVNSETYKSEHDGLTDCYNRVHLDKVKGSYEMSNTYIIIFIDVNNLKKMNDICGHEAGDALIRSAASHLKFWETYGEVYRMGGDEFMIVVCNKKPVEVQKLIESWYPTVGILNRETDGFRCVLSYGVAIGRKGSDFDTVQKQADDRMYDMKVAIKKKFGEPMR